jgi:hypothetical protein
MKIKSQRLSVKLITPTTVKRYKVINPAYKVEYRIHTNYQRGYNRKCANSQAQHSQYKNYGESEQSRTTTLLGRNSPKSEPMNIDAIDRTPHRETTSTAHGPTSSTKVTQRGRRPPET